MGQLFIADLLFTIFIEATTIRRQIPQGYFVTILETPLQIISTQVLLLDALGFGDKNVMLMHAIFNNIFKSPPDYLLSSIVIPMHHHRRRRRRPSRRITSVQISLGRPQSRPLMGLTFCQPSLISTWPWSLSP